MRGIPRKNVQYSTYFGLSEDESRKQRCESRYGREHDFSVGPSMAAAPSHHHVLCSGALQIHENGAPSDILTTAGSPPRPSFLKPQEIHEKSAAAENDFIAQDWLTELKSPSSFDSLIGNSGTRSGGNLISSASTSGLMNSQRINAGSPKYAETLQLCTEGLGFESSDETDSSASSPRFESCKSEFKALSTDDQEEHFDGDIPAEAVNNNDKNGHGFKNPITIRAPRAAFKSFPPPLPSISRNGQPSVMMKSYKRDGRFVLQEVKVPSHEVLHAWRGDGRLKLQLVQQQEEKKDDTLFRFMDPIAENNIDAKISDETA